MTNNRDLALASALRARHPTPERNACIFWLAAKRAREVIREGRVELAELFIIEIGDAAKQLASRSAPERALARHMRRTAVDLDIALAATILDIAQDLTRSAQ